MEKLKLNLVNTRDKNKQTIGEEHGKTLELPTDIKICEKINEIIDFINTEVPRMLK